MPRPFRIRPGFAVIAAATLALNAALLPAPTLAAMTDGASAAVSPKKHRTKKPAKAPAPRQRVTFDKDSGETTAERDRRLKRECKGRPNAGACLGYAS